MTPHNNNILFRPEAAIDRTEGGIIIPGSVQGVSDKGTIVAVGNGTKERPMRFSPGMKAYRVHLWGTEILVDGVKHYLMDDKAVIATE